MKKISLKIELSNIIMFIIIFGAFFFISVGQMRTVLEESVEANLSIEVESLANDFYALINDRRLIVLNYKANLEKHLTSENLKQDEKVSSIYEEATAFTTPMVDRENIFSVYSWLVPDEVNNFYGMTIQNFQLNNSGTVKFIGPHKSSEMVGPSWEWFWGPEKTGTYISLPYDWEGIDGQLISYAESLIVDGKFVGVVGTDFKVTEFGNLLLNKKIMDTGYFAMTDENLNFIFHKEATGKNISSWFTDIKEDEIDSIKKSKNDSGYIIISHNKGKQIISYQRLTNGWYILGLPTTSEVYKSLNKLIGTLVIILVLTFLIITITSIILGMTISKPIRDVAENLKEISEGDGDLTKTIMVKTEDETKILADSFNRFIANLKVIVGNIKNSSIKNESIRTDLDHASANAASAAVEITQNIESINSQIDNLNSDIQVTTSGIEEIGSNLSHFKSQIDEQVSAVEESSASIEEMIASLDNVAGVTNKKLESTRDLVEITLKGDILLKETSTQFKEGVGDRIGQIREMVSVISGIAGRTNLLAMNAAIEAAHAGESGKGFAVVADEIRKMAEESSESSSNIERIISVIVKAIETTDDNVDKTAAAFKEITTEVKDIDIALNEIAANTVEIASGGQEILTSVSLLNNTTSQIANGIKEIEIGAQEITKSMLDIQNISSEVNNGVQEINSGIKYVSGSFEDVTKLSSELEDETKKLTKEVNRFII
jgi:methyl-accepting chemotaxis protein